MDSSYERQTLRQHLSLRKWPAEKRGVGVSIRKPLFDMAPQDGRPDDGAEPVIPDFLVETGRVALIAETMGYNLPAYRERKARMHREMSHVCGGVPVVERNFCVPPAASHAERDTAFWRACRAALAERADARSANGTAA